MLYDAVTAVNTAAEWVGRQQTTRTRSRWHPASTSSTRGHSRWRARARSSHPADRRTSPPRRQSGRRGDGGRQGGRGGGRRPVGAVLPGRGERGDGPAGERAPERRHRGDTRDGRERRGTDRHVDRRRDRGARRRRAERTRDGAGRPSQVDARCGRDAAGGPRPHPRAVTVPGVTAAVRAARARVGDGRRDGRASIVFPPHGPHRTS